MKIFLSGQGNIDEALLKNRLYSYFYEGYKTDALTPALELAAKLGQCVLLDSGAFSAFNSKKEIDLKRFAGFVARYRAHFHLVAALDVIGDAEASWSNFEALRDAGADTFPTFHYGEPFSFLERMKKHSDVIGLGGVAQLGGGAKLLAFLSQAWKHLVDSSGKPTHRVHGFAITSPSLIQRFPWYSVDSMSWLFSANNGSVCLFDGRKLHNIIVTETSSQAKELTSKHYNMLSKHERDVLHRYLEQNGTTLDEVRAHHAPRQRLAAVAFQRLAELATPRLGAHQSTLY